MRFSPQPRKAFTLIELMVVIVVVLALTSIVGIVVWVSQEGENVPRAANLIQGALVQAKNRAAQEKLRNGVRFVPAGANSSAELIFIQDPGPYAVGRVKAENQVQGAGLKGVVTGEYNFAGSVQPGDSIEFLGGGQVYRIESLIDAKTLQLATALSLPTGQSIEPGNDAKLPNYRIYRQPRPIQGLESIKLPENAVVRGGVLGGSGSIDIGSHGDGAVIDFDAPFNIIFGEKGRVVGPAASANVIYLWVGDTEPDRSENNYLVVIYTRTGTIATYPVNTDPSLGDKYFNARAGRAAGGL